MEEQVTLFREYLEEQELSQATIRIYMRYIRKFMIYLDGETISKKNVIDYKVMLMESSYKITTVNLNIIAVNKFIRFFRKRGLRCEDKEISKMPEPGKCDYGEGVQNAVRLCKGKRQGKVLSDHEGYRIDRHTGQRAAVYYG